MRNGNEIGALTEHVAEVGLEARDIGTMEHLHGRRRLRSGGVTSQAERKLWSLHLCDWVVRWTLSHLEAGFVASGVGSEEL